MGVAIGWAGGAGEREGPVGSPIANAPELVGRAFEVYGPAILGYLRGLTRDPEVAADLTQEAFLRLHVEVGACRTPNDVRAWLYRVAANLAMSRGRRAQVAARHAPTLHDPDAARSTEQVILDRERDAALRSALAKLPERDRDVLLLAASGLTGPELADRLGRSQLATRTLLCRARAKLRQHVASIEGAAG